eukprot:TRINITY_DN56755_c0_g1_i1.p3 TRINITY_DN56755_c0_g1~~TRINITY_DN56755_c0_g1_i1.p3  ORF type:complete len:126 (-),score=35.37 TRINITY_DN56755_c0_g1_i1:185-562(-)
MAFVRTSLRLVLLFSALQGELGAVAEDAPSAHRPGSLKAKMIEAYASSAALRQLAPFSQLLAASLIYSGEVTTAEEARQQVDALVRGVEDPVSEKDFLLVLRRAGAKSAKELLRVLRNVEEQKEL